MNFVVTALTYPSGMSEASGRKHEDVTLVNGSEILKSLAQQKITELEYSGCLPVVFHV